MQHERRDQLKTGWSLIQHDICYAAVSYTILCMAGEMLLQTDFCAKRFNLLVCRKAQRGWNDRNSKDGEVGTTYKWRGLRWCSTDSTCFSVMNIISPRSLSQLSGFVIHVFCICEADVTPQDCCTCVFSLLCMCHCEISSVLSRHTFCSAFILQSVSI